MIRTKHRTLIKQLIPDSEKADTLKIDEFESDEPVEIDVSEKSLSDYHLFALLCWRNFATLPEMTLIESVQRVLR